MIDFVTENSINIGLVKYFDYIQMKIGWLGIKLDLDFTYALKNCGNTIESVI